MASGQAPDVTRLLVSWSQGDQAALDELVPLVYGELRRLASAYLRLERSNHTLQSTALVHEAFMRLVNQQEAQWRSAFLRDCVALYHDDVPGLMTGMHPPSSMEFLVAAPEQLKELSPGQSITASVRRQGTDYVLENIHISRPGGAHKGATP